MQDMRIFVEIFVSATEFCRRNKTRKIKSDWICATCCGDKILLQRQRFSQNFSSTHEAICRRDVSPQHVGATSCMDHILYVIIQSLHVYGRYGRFDCINIDIKFVDIMLWFLFPIFLFRKYMKNPNAIILCIQGKKINSLFFWPGLFKRWIALSTG